MIRTKVLTLFLYKFTVNADEIDASVEKKCHNFSSTHPFELILVSSIFDILLSILKQKYSKFVVEKKKKNQLLEKSERRPFLLKQEEFKFLPEL